MSAGVKVYKIRVYPIKGLDPVDVESTQTVKKGSLKHDREFAIFDEEGNAISGKREKNIHRIRAFYDLKAGTVKLEFKNQSESFVLEETKKISDWLSEVLGYRVFLKRSKDGGFPDDKKAHGPTVISLGSIRRVSVLFGVSEENVRRRFRANIELDVDIPFWEDRLVGREFRLGGVVFRGEGISKRCPVPTRDPFTAEVYSGFVNKFVDMRREELPRWADKTLFEDTYYRLSINTNTLSGGKMSVGDELYLL